MDEAKIMVVEDEIIVAKDLAMNLKKLGYTVCSLVTSGEDAIDRVVKNKPDLILMDIMLQGKMDGIETAQNINSHFNIPIIYLTALTDKKILARAKLTKPFGYLIKPINSNDLHTTIEISLYKKKAEKKLQKAYDGLEQRVEERTSELVRANNDLKQEIEDRIRAEKKLCISKEQIRNLSFQLLTAQEQERKRISSELHDELGQSLTALKLQIRSIEKKLNIKQKALREDCLEILRYINEVIENVRLLSHNLSPLILGDLGLSSAIQWLSKNFCKLNSVKCSIDVQDINLFLSPEFKIFVYRIFQESLTNIAKHAQASHVSIVAQCTNSSVIFHVEDNGKGFDVEKVTSRNTAIKGLGLAGINERVQMMGGSMEISSQIGIGTKIAFMVPKTRKGNC